MGFGPYSSPDEYGLRIFGDVDLIGGYEYDMFAVWRDADGGWLHATDAGTSVDAPFEGFDLDQLTRDGCKHEAIAALQEWASRDKWSGKRSDHVHPDAAALIERIAADD